MIAPLGGANRGGGYATSGAQFLALEQGSVRDIERATLAVLDKQQSQSLLVTILDCCLRACRCLYASIALLDECDGLLVGKVISSSDTSHSVRLATESIEPPPDSFLGPLSDRDELSLPALASDVSGQVIEYKLLDSENLVVRVFADGKPRISLRYYDLVRPRLAITDAAAIQRALGVSSIAILPLLEAERCMGVLCVGGDAPLTDADLPLVNIFAGLAAAAARYARVQRDLREREEQVNLLLKTTIDAQEEERERICLEIHDGVAQTLAPAFQYLQTLDNQPGLSTDLRAIVHKASSQVRTAIHEARDVIATLRPAALDTLGLVPTLRHELDELCAQTGMQIDFDAPPVRFPKLIETALYRIIHEAVNNVSKHARAHRVVLRLKQDQDVISVEVQDDGLGFDLTSLERRVLRRGVGLLSMRKRAEMLQGSFEVVSHPGNGTSVRVRVPLAVSAN